MFWEARFYTENDTPVSKYHEIRDAELPKAGQPVDKKLLSPYNDGVVTQIQPAAMYKALDGYATYWTPKFNGCAGLTYEFQSLVPLSVAKLNVIAPAANYAPAGLKAYFSEDGANWGEPVTVDSADCGENIEIDLSAAPVDAQYFKLEQTGWSLYPWEISDIILTSSADYGIESAPGAPANPIAEPSYFTSCISWDASSTDSGEFDGYKLYIDGVVTAEVDSRTLTAEVAGLDEDTEYTVEIRAYKDILVSEPVSVTFTTTHAPILPVNGLTAVTSHCTATLSWTAPAEEEALGYRIYDGNDALIKTVAGAASAKTVVQELLPETSYTLKVATYAESGGESEKVSINATTSATPPEDAQLEDNGWVLAASHTQSGQSVTNVLSSNTWAWNTGAQMTSNMWLTVDLGGMTYVKKFYMESNNGTDWPNTVNVKTSNDGVNWDTTVLSAVSMSRSATVSFPEDTQVRYLRFSPAANKANYWNIKYLRIYAGAPATLSVVENFTVDGANAEGAIVTWDTYPISVDGFNIYNGETLAAKASANASSAYVVGLDAGTVESLSIEAYKGEKISPPSEISYTMPPATVLDSVKGLEIASFAVGGVTLTWNAVSGAESYDIYHNGVFAANVETSEYTGNTAVAGRNSYAVIARDTDGNISLIGDTVWHLLGGEPENITNVALNKTVRKIQGTYYNSSYNDASLPYIVDGSDNAGSDGTKRVLFTNCEANPAILEIDLGADYVLTDAVVVTGYNTGNNALTPNSSADASYRLQWTDSESWDGAAWYDIPGGGVTNNAAANAVKALTFSNAVTTRFVRAVFDKGYVDGSNRISRIIEITINGGAPTPAQIPALTIDNVAFTSGGGTALGDTVTSVKAEISYTNPVPFSKVMTPVFVIKKDGRLVDTRIGNKSVAVNGVSGGTVTVLWDEFAEIDLADGYEISLYLWDGMYAMRPVSPSVYTVTQ
jgi:hypothetical protein